MALSCAHCRTLASPIVGSGSRLVHGILPTFHSHCKSLSLAARKFHLTQPVECRHLSPMTPSRAHIMRSAWRLARSGARRYGGTVRAYFRAALRLAWSRSRRSTIFTHARSACLTLARRGATFLLSNTETHSCQTSKQVCRYKRTRRFAMAAAGAKLGYSISFALAITS